MPSEREQIVAAVREALRSGGSAQPSPRPPAAEVADLVAEIAELHSFVVRLAQGDLGASLAQRGAMAGALKSLQASLRHLTWQTKRVAEGDFSQRVDFMGEFSAAFNSMVEALSRAHDELAKRNKTLLRLNAKLEQLATTDVLTGTCNRRRFYELLRDDVRRAVRYQHPLSLLLADIDRFKRVNDTHGHAVGDQVLKGIAHHMGRSLRTPDRLARWGGEEFVVLAPETSAQSALALAKRVCLTIRRERFGVAGQITVSVGVAELRPGESGDALLARADAALYEAKESGRDRAVLAR